MWTALQAMHSLSDCERGRLWQVVSRLLPEHGVTYTPGLEPSLVLTGMLTCS